MRLYLFRHAAAVPHGTPRYLEDERPLTPDGHAQARKVAAGLQRLNVEPGLILTSLLRRAVETAEEVAQAWPSPLPIKTLEALMPEAPAKQTSLVLKAWASQKELILVGHEPHLSLWLAELVAPGGLRCDFKKAGVACVELDQVPPPSGSGTLRWFMTPKALAKIGQG